MTFTSQKMEKTSIVKWLKQSPVLQNLQGEVATEILLNPFFMAISTKSYKHGSFPLTQKFHSWECFLRK